MIAYGVQRTQDELYQTCYNLKRLNSLLNLEQVNPVLKLLISTKKNNFISLNQQKCFQL